METLLDLHVLPIIDMAFTAGSVMPPVKMCTRQAAKKLHKALSENGMAVLVNHGVSGVKLQDVNKKMRKFCYLPIDVRNQYAIDDNESLDNQGYLPPARDNLPYQHGYNIQSNKGKFPDTEIPGFRDSVLSLADDFKSLARALLQFIAIGLDLPTNYFLKEHDNILCENGLSIMRMTYYPPLEENLRSITRRHEHTDHGTFTLIAQDAENGLEVKHGGKWARVGYLPGSILIIVSDLLEIWTGGVYTSLYHKMRTPLESKIRSRGQHAVSFYIHPSNLGAVSPIIYKENEDEIQVVEKTHKCSIFSACVCQRFSGDAWASCC